METVEQGWLVGSLQEAPDWEKTRNGFAHVMGSVFFAFVFWFCAFDVVGVTVTHGTITYSSILLLI